MTESHKALRAAIYARISEDTAGEARGVARQLEDARALAQARGWETVSEFTDNDISAFSGVRRPGYEALMASVDDRLVDRIVVYRTSRLWRSRKERAIAIERLADAKVGVVAVSGPDLDLSSASGRMLAGILGEFDTAESAIKSERVARASEQRAAEGRPSGGLGYGWRRLSTLDERGNAVTTGHEINPDEAAIVREVVKRLTAGETLKAVTSDLNDRGVIAPGSEHRRGYRAADNAAGERWGTSSVRKMALRPSNAGLRVHRGHVVGKGVWPALITEAQHHKVAAVLSDPGRRAHGGDAVRRHLLSYGIGACGICGTRLRVAKVGANKLYVCDAPKSCVGRRQEFVDQFVEGVIIERLKREDAVDLLAPTVTAGTDPEAVIRLAAIRERLDDAADAYAEGRIDADQMARISARLRPEMEDAERATRPELAAPVPPELRQLAGHRDAREVWDRLDILTKRAVMEALQVTVTILPTKRGPGFNPEAVAVGWAKR